MSASLPRMISGEDEWLSHTDWIELDRIGHCPQLDVPLETAQLIVGFTAH